MSLFLTDLHPISTFAPPHPMDESVGIMCCLQYKSTSSTCNGSTTSGQIALKMGVRAGNIFISSLLDTVPFIHLSLLALTILPFIFHSEIASQYAGPLHITHHAYTYAGLQTRACRYCGTDLIVAQSYIILPFPRPLCHSIH